MKIFIGADHGGEKIAKEIYEELKQEGLDVAYTKLENYPTDDYPDFAFDVCNNVIKEKDSLGILSCGTGIGISIAANKVKGIRCAHITSENDAYYAKNHNRANVIAFGGLGLEKSLKLVKIFLEAPYDEDERHLRRIEKIINYERGA